MISLSLFKPLAVVFDGVSQLPAHAYVGPGAGLTAIGTFLALIIAVIVAIIGFFWYPIKRFLKRLKDSHQNSE